jgi:hypothetical protein
MFLYVYTSTFQIIIISLHLLTLHDLLLERFTLTFLPLHLAAISI